jgi:gag-polypeptide of LTR copia-type
MPLLALPSPSEEARLTNAWDRDDEVARYLLSSHLPDHTALEVSDLGTAEERWTRVTQEYQAMSAFAHHDLEAKFLEIRCPKGGDVRTFLTDLPFKRQELAAADVKLDDQDYQRTVLRSIPGELATFAAALLSAHAIATASQPTRLDTNPLISHICEKADRLKNRRARTGNSNGTKDRQEDEALAVTSGNAGTKKTRKGKCRGCGKPGHRERECRASHQQGSTSSTGDSSAQAAAAPTSTSNTTPSHPSSCVETRPVANAACVLDDGDGVWAVEVAFPTLDQLLFAGGLPGPTFGSEVYLDPLEQPLEGTTSLVDNEGSTVDDSDGLQGAEEDTLPLDAHTFTGDLTGPATGSEGSQPPLEHVSVETHPPTTLDASRSRPDPGAREDRQPSWDVDPQALQAYQPHTHTQEDRRSAVFVATVQLEGERIAAAAARELAVAPPPAPATPQTPPPDPDLPPEPPARSDDEHDEDPIRPAEELPDELPLDHEPIATTCPAHTWRPAHRARDLTSGEGVAAVTGDDDANEAGGVSSDTPHTSFIPEDFGALEHVFAAAETSCAEALLPRAPPEARHPFNQPLWEAAIHGGLAMPESAGTWCLDPEHAAPTSVWVFKLKVNKKTAYSNGVSTPREVVFMQDPSKFRPSDPGGCGQGLQGSCRWLALSFLWVLSCSATLSGPSALGRFVSHLSSTPLVNGFKSLNFHFDPGGRALGLQESSRRWPPPPLHCQAAGAPSWAALATQAPLHLRYDQTSSSAAELMAARDVLYEAAGALSWAALAIHFIVPTVACYAANPGPAHWDAAKQTDRYLAGTLDLWLVHGETTRTLEGCARDASYCEAVGALDRAAQATPLDTVSIAARIAATPGPAHQEAKRISRYPAGTLDPRLAYSEATRALEGYADIDSSAAAHHRTTSGHAPLIDRGDVPWASKCQETAAPSPFPHRPRRCPWASKSQETVAPSPSSTTDPPSPPHAITPPHPLDAHRCASPPDQVGGRARHPTGLFPHRRHGGRRPRQGVAARMLKHLAAPL